jgi:hypothetical protein
VFSDGHTNHKDPVGYLEPGFPFQILQSPTFNNINHIENQRILVVASPDDLCEWELGINIYDIGPKTVRTSEQVEIKRMSSALKVPFSTRPAKPLILLTVCLKRSTKSPSGMPFAHMMLMNCLFRNAP